MPYIHRNILPYFRAALDSFPAVLLTGPRQSGKTTFLKQEIAGATYKILALDQPAPRNFAKDDPVGFVEAYPPPVILDEIQYAPELLPVIKGKIDEHRAPGQWILTGSQQFQLMQNITESLAGRVALFTLLPFSLSELFQAHPKLGFEDWIYAGGYPVPVLQPDSQRALWMESYLQTYLERDVRNLRQVGDLRQFELFLRAIAARSSQVLNYSEISRDVGVTVPTIRQWLSILEASYTIFILPPYFKNFGKRLIKAPKVYLLDTGLMAALLGYRNGREIVSGPLAGAFFETAVVSEFVKLFYHAGLRPSLFFWRTRDGHEVDLLIQSNGKLFPVEIKITATPTPVHTQSLQRLRDIMQDASVQKAVLICRVDSTTPMAHQTLALPWKQIETYFQSEIL
ncbi:MAG: ATP-binding protein [Calditrichaeota bacterium]|nr:MAG: ATP-binding protein [Calditrichota bacterium]